MQHHFETIKRARAQLAAVPKGAVSASTVADYRRKMDRLLARGGSHIDGRYAGALAEALKMPKKASWFALRAAMLFSLRADLEAALSDQDRMQRARKAVEAVNGRADWSRWEEQVRRVHPHPMPCSLGTPLIPPDS